MATDAERVRFRKLAGQTLPDGDENPARAYTDAEADAYLNAQPVCPMRSGGGLDVYAAASAAWLDKADELDVAAIGVESGVLVKQVAQADASYTLARPTALGTVKLAANDPNAMRSLAARLLRRSCNGGGFRSADVLPPELMRPTSRDPFATDYDGPEWIERALILDAVDNPDGVINLPEVD